MAISLVNVETTQWIGTVNGLPTTLCGQNGRVVLVNIDWSVYNLGNGESLGLEVDMSGIAPTNQLDLIRSVYIDNIASPTPMYVYFPDTGFTVVCKPYTATWAPVVTNARKATVYGIGFTTQQIPLVNVFFTNIFMPLAYQELGPNFTATPPSITYVGTAVSVSDAGSYAFNTFAIGAAAANRRILVGVVGARVRQMGDFTSDANSPASISAFNINGGPETIIEQIQANSYVNPSFGTVAQALNLTVGLGIAHVPLGTTADIAINFSSSRNMCRIYVATLEGVTNNIPTGSDERQAAITKNSNPLNDTTQSLPSVLALPELGALFGVCASGRFTNNSPSNCVLTGADLALGVAGSLDNISGNNGSQARIRSNPFFLNDILTAQPSYPITATYGASTAAAIVDASFAPS